MNATLLQWAGSQGIHIGHIQPGKPQQNVYVERFNRAVRYEWLSQYGFIAQIDWRPSSPPNPRRTYAAATV